MLCYKNYFEEEIKKKRNKIIKVEIKMVFDVMLIVLYFGYFSFKKWVVICNLMNCIRMI